MLRFLVFVFFFSLFRTHPAPAATVFRDIFTAVSLLHNLNLVHCSLKLKNIYISNLERAVVGNLEHVLDLLSPACDDAVHVYRGNTLYRAPELYDASSSMTKASDMYALGVCLAQAFLGVDHVTTNVEVCRLRSLFRCFCSPLFPQLEKGPSGKRSLARRSQTLAAFSTRQGLAKPRRRVLTAHL